MYAILLRTLFLLLRNTAGLLRHFVTMINGNRYFVNILSIKNRYFLENYKGFRNMMKGKESGRGFRKPLPETGDRVYNKKKGLDGGSCI